MLQAIVARLPPQFIRAVGRAQFRYPPVAAAVRLLKGRLTGTGTIQHGVGAGLLFDATGGYPGYLLGTSEPEEQAFVAEHLAPAGVFYDIGANVGFYSTIAARLVGPEGCVYAFEPYGPSVVSAAANAERNGFGHVNVVHAAVSTTEGRMSLNLSGLSAKHRLGEGPGVDVVVVAIDPWMQRTKARPPTLVMIDVEGAEIDVLDGMRETMSTYRPVVCVEVHWLGERFLDYCSNELAELDYAVSNLHGGSLATDGRWHAVLTPAPRRAHFSANATVADGAA